MDDINKYTKMNAWTSKQGCKDANKWRKPNKMAQSKHSNHEGSKTCYHTKGKGKHVKSTTPTRETLICKAKQKERKASHKQANITKMYSHTWSHPNKPPKGMDATKQIVWPQRLTSTNPQRENKQEHGKGLDLSKQAWIQTQKAWKRANKAQTCKNELIQTLYWNLGVWM